MEFNMAFGRTFKFIVMLVSITTCFKSFTQASPDHSSSTYSRSVHKDNFKYEIRKFAENFIQSLPIDERFSVYDIPSKLKPEYENCLDKAQDRLNSRAWDWGVNYLDYKEIESVTTQEVDKFVKTMNSIVLKSELDQKINDAICDLIHKNGMVKDDIKKYSETEYNSRYYKVKDKLNDIMSYDHKTYVRISEVEKAVKDEFSVLIKRVKGQGSDSKNKSTKSDKANKTTQSSHGDSAGDSWQDFWDWLSGKKSSKKSDATPTTSYEPSAPPYDYAYTGPSAPPYDYAGEKCSICLDNIKSYETLGYLNCGHYFHEKCIQTSLNSYGRKCPLCDTHTDSIAYTVVVPLQ